MVSRITDKKPYGAAKDETVKQPEVQLSVKTVEFIAKLQKIQDNVLRDISEL
jgi:hypothetical protein